MKIPSMVAFQDFAVVGDVTRKNYIYSLILNDEGHSGRVKATMGVKKVLHLEKGFLCLICSFEIFLSFFPHSFPIYS